MIGPGTTKMVFQDATPTSEAKFFINRIRHEVVGTVGEVIEWLRLEGICRSTDAGIVAGVPEHRVRFNLKQNRVERFNERWVRPYVEPVKPFDPVDRSCRTKVRHASKEKALHRIALTMLSPGYVMPQNRQFTPYACEHCGGWHIGHTRYHKEFAT